jgi:hypothetical protein
MNNTTMYHHASDHYFRDPFSIPSEAPTLPEQLNLKAYLSKLAKLQFVSILILLMSIILQAVAVATNDWFILNINEYVQTAKGGLWLYCYMTTSKQAGTLDCFKYEELPNYYVFANDRLFDSRVLLLCSSGFLLLLLCIDIFGFVSLSICGKRGCDVCDALIRQRSAKVKLNGRNMSASTQVLKGNDYSIDILSNRSFRTEINEMNQSQSNAKKVSLKPVGYFTFTAITIATIVGCIMEFILKLAGFLLFDAYINQLLSFNKVFQAYRSWSYWAMIGAIVFMVVYFIFKLVTSRYASALTKQLVNAEMLSERTPSSSDAVSTVTKSSNRMKGILVNGNSGNSDRSFPQVQSPNRNRQLVGQNIDSKYIRSPTCRPNTANLMSHRSNFEANISPIPQAKYSSDDYSTTESESVVTLTPTQYAKYIEEPSEVFRF